MKIFSLKSHNAILTLSMLILLSITWTIPVQAQSFFDGFCSIVGTCTSSSSSFALDLGAQQQATTTTTPANSGGNNNNGGNNGTTSTPLAVPNTLGFTNLADIVNQLSVYIIPFAVIGFIGCVIYSGYIRLFSAGDVNGEKKSVVVAKSAAIGFAIIFFANLFLLLLSNILKLSAV